MKRSTAKKDQSSTDGDEDDIEETPTKRRKVSPKKTAAPKEEIEAVFKDEEETADLLNGIA